MSRIAVVKVRGSNDLEWNPPSFATTGLRLLRATRLLARLQSTAGQTFMPQLTLPYLAGLGEAYNQAYGTTHEYTILDDHESRLDLSGYDMVWLTAQTSTAPGAYRVADRVRARGVPVVIGGIHATLLPEEAAAHATSVFVGEAEGGVFELLADFDAGRPLRPRYEGGRSAALETLPVPRWRSAAVADYCPWLVPVQTSRGCRNACRFCSTTRFQGVQRRHRPVAEIVAELRALQDEGVLTREKTVFFTDNNIVSDNDHRRGVRDTRYARALFEALVPLGITWVGQGEVQVAEEPALVALMAESGCHQLLVGLESVSQAGLDGVGKEINTPARYAAALETLHDHGIANIGCFILGLDGDGPDVFEATATFVERYVDIPQLSLLTPFPGTALYRRLKREGRLLHEDWSRYDLTHVVYRPETMSPAELERRYEALGRRIFSPQAIVRRALRYAARRTVNGLPRFGRFDRFTSVLAPNLIYRGLVTHAGERHEPGDPGRARQPALDYRSRQQRNPTTCSPSAGGKRSTYTHWR